MRVSVTFVAQRDEVRFIVVARVAAKLEMMDLQTSRRSASLTSPVIALQHLPAKPPVFFWS